MQYGLVLRWTKGWATDWTYDFWPGHLRLFMLAALTYSKTSWHSCPQLSLTAVSLHVSQWRSQRGKILGLLQGNFRVKSGRLLLQWVFLFFFTASAVSANKEFPVFNTNIKHGYAKKTIQLNQMVLDQCTNLCTQLYQYLHYKQCQMYFQCWYWNRKNCFNLMF